MLKGIPKEDDLLLWNQIRRSDRCAFAALYEKHMDALYNYAMKICRNRALAEDSIQDLFIELWRYRETLSDVVSVRYYLYRALRRRIVKNESDHSWLTNEGIRWENIQELTATPLENSMIEAEVRDEKTRKLQKYLNDLSPRQYEAIVLYFFDEFSYEEIAAIMDVNEQSSRNLIQRGLAQLRQHAQFLISWLPALFVIIYRL
jgi:RNA polymerase sigma-70 factor (ECF subfamily)